MTETAGVDLALACTIVTRDAVRVELRARAEAILWVAIVASLLFGYKTSQIFVKVCQKVSKTVV